MDRRRLTLKRLFGVALVGAAISVVPSLARAGRTWLRRKPTGLLRLALRLPVLLYRWHLGWLLGHRFLMLTHRGRRTGIPRRTVLEVIRHDPAAKESIVIAAWGARSDWYQNIQASPALAIQIGRDHYVPQQRFLTSAEVERELRTYTHAHPWAARILVRLFDANGGAGQNLSAIARTARMVSFRPRD